MTYKTVLINPGAGKPCTATVRNTSAFPTDWLVDLFQEVLTVTNSRSNTKGYLPRPWDFNWLCRDFHLWIKPLRSKKEWRLFTGAAQHASERLNRPAMIILRLAPTCKPEYIALLMEHEIRHLMGESHRMMRGQPYQAYTATEEGKHHYMWARGETALVAGRNC